MKSPTPRPAGGGAGGGCVLQAQSSGCFPPDTGPDSLLETQLLMIMQMSVCFGFGPFMLRCSQSINQNSVGHGQTGWSGCRPSDGEPPWGSRDPLEKELRRILFSCLSEGSRSFKHCFYLLFLTGDLK